MHAFLGLVDQDHPCWRPLNRVVHAWIHSFVRHRGRLLLRGQGASKRVDQQRALARPGHAAQAGKHSQRKAYIGATQIVRARTFDRHPAAGLPPRRKSRLPLAAQPARRHSVGARHPIRRTLCHNLSAGGARSGPYVDQMVGSTDQLQVVLDHNHCVPLVAQFAQRAHQCVHLRGMKSTRRLVQQHRQ